MKSTTYDLIVTSILIAFFSALGGYCIATREPVWGVLSFLLASICVARTIRLYRNELNKTTFMFNAIENDDFTFRFVEEQDSRSEARFNAALNRIKDIMTKAKIELSEREKYYELILERVGTGVVIADSQGRVYLVNRAALRLFGAERLSHLSQLKALGQDFSGQLLSAKPHSHLQYKVNNERGEIDLSITVSGVQAKDRELRIFAVSDIKGELDEKEIESWMRLVRVLTHEIMNSITPITSLSDTLKEMAGEDETDLRKGLETIGSTGKSLIAFVESYRKITRIPDPEMGSLPITPLLERVARLDPRPGINVAVDVRPADLTGYGDENQLSQVLINLIKNAKEALKDRTDGRIVLSARPSAIEGRVSITVADNGPGIPPEMAEHIFVPFFTTKEGGSGIGLGISRQILRRHGGGIHLKPSETGTVFEIVF